MSKCDATLDQGTGVVEKSLTGRESIYGFSGIPSTSRPAFHEDFLRRG